MPASLLSLPPSVAYNGDDIWVKIGTDLVDSDAAAKLVFAPTGSGPTLAETFTFEWGGQSIVFTVEADTNATATAIPTKGGGESIADYCLRVAEALRQNGLITTDFQVLESATTVELMQKVPGALALTVTGTLSNVTLTPTDGTDPNTEPNLAAQLQVWQAGTTANLDELITTLHATYDADTGTTAINLSEVFPVQPILPTEGHISPTIFVSWLRAVSVGAWVKYYLRYADKYGAPAVPEALLRTEQTFFAIHGSRSLDIDSVGSLSATLQVLHNHRRKGGGTFRKPITDRQPDWLNIFTKVAITGCNVEWTITWDDGSTSTEPYTGTPFSLESEKVYHIRSTPLNLDITPPSAGLLPILINFRFKGDPGGGELVLAQIPYSVRACTDWDVFLLFDNGMGGVESALFRGKPKHSYAASRDTARIARSEDTSIKTGEVTQFNPQGSELFEFNSGWQERYYVEHLRQMLLGKLWRIDMVNKRFEALTIETSEVEVHKADEQLHSLTIKCRQAWFDKDKNV